MKKLSKPKKVLIVIASVIVVLALAVSIFLISVRPGPETDDMLFDVGMFNPISFIAFDGNGYVSSVVGNDDTFNVPSMLNISFEPSGRTKWHTRDGGQILICSYGTGYYQVEGEAPQILRVGDVVMIEPGIKHWHGAGADGWLSHIAMSIGSPVNNFLESVTDEEYALLPSQAVEFNERETSGHTSEALSDLGQGAMFPLGMPNPFADHFTGNTYLAMLISPDEVFDCPPMSNVTFEPCARTDWHSHDGGQILIAIGGTGYHQIEGHPLEILQPGDVAEVEPGVVHWHGASSDSWFSHIAISTNPSEGKVNWMEPVTDEVYFSDTNDNE